MVGALLYMNREDPPIHFNMPRQLFLIALERKKWAVNKKQVNWGFRNISW